MKAFITGISGQDGSYLSELLLEKGYEVHGIVRRNSISENQSRRIDHLDVNLHYGDMTDQTCLERLLGEIKPDEIYNLAAQSHVGISFEVPEYTCQVDGMGVLKLLEAYKNQCPEARFYQAGTSEMFGNNAGKDGYQREDTPMHPVSPYAASKVFAFNLCRIYREAYKLPISNGILFNHESPRRGSNFVTAKIVNTALEIKRGEADKIVMGNIESKRDWGHAKDYVKAMWLMLQNKPDDYVCATGETASVRDALRFVFGELGLDYKDYLKQDSKYFRKNELHYLKGDASRLKELGWKPEYDWKSTLLDMIYAAKR